MLKTVHERKVSGLGKLHIMNMKNGTMCWRGAYGFRCVGGVPKVDRCRKSPAFTVPGRAKCQEGLRLVSGQRGKCPWSAKMPPGVSPPGSVKARGRGAHSSGDKCPLGRGRGSSAEARICERLPSRLGQRRLGASGASKRLDSRRRVLGQWPEVCAGEPRPSRLRGEKVCMA